MSTDRINISALSSVSSVAAGDLVPMTQGSTGADTGTTRKATVAQIFASPALSGVPTSTTAAPGTNTTQIATTAFVQAATGGAGAVTSVAGRTGAVVLAVADVSGAAALAGPTFTGVPAAPTASPGTNTTQLATTAFAQAAVAAAVLAPVGQPLPLAFVIAGKPGASQNYNLVLATACTIPANFAGTVVYQGTITTASATFNLNKISGGVTTGIGTVIVLTTGKTNKTLSVQGAASLAAGDVLQLVGPSSQDATLADVGLTVLAAKA